MRVFSLFIEHWLLGSRCTSYRAHAFGHQTSVRRRGWPGAVRRSRKLLWADTLLSPGGWLKRHADVDAAFLILDRAGWQSTQRLRVPDHVHLLFLPPYSPELQPAEHLWPLTKRPSSTAILPRSRSWRMSKRLAVSRSKPVAIWSARRHCSTGGLSVSENDKRQGEIGR
jgi:hypothetical protein